MWQDKVGLKLVIDQLLPLTLSLTMYKMTVCLGLKLSQGSETEQGKWNMPGIRYLLFQAVVSCCQRFM